MPTGTKFIGYKTQDLDSTVCNFNAHGVSASVSAGQTANIDYTLTDDCELTGLHLITNAGTYGDYAHLQVVDVSGAFTGTPGTVLNQFVTSWFISANADNQFDTPYPAKIYAGLTIRIIYHATSGLLAPATFVGINYKLHKILA